MKRALAGLALVAVACTSTEREVLLVAGDVPVTVAVSRGETCIEVGKDAHRGSWCAPDGLPDAVWLGATPVGDGLVVVGQAPAEVASVALAGEGGTRRLAVVRSEHGRFFVGVAVQPGDYEVAAAREDGSEHVAGHLSVPGDGTTTLTMVP